MEKQLLKYEMSQEVVTYLLKACNTQQIRGVNEATDLLNVVKMLQDPINAEDIEKEQLKVLKEKFEPKKEKK